MNFRTTLLASGPPAESLRYTASIYAAPYHLRLRDIALTLRAGLRFAAASLLSAGSPTPYHSVVVNEIYSYALKLLRGRDYTIAELCGKLEAKFGSVPPEIIEDLGRKKFLNDRRFAENYVAKRKSRGAQQLREELTAHGIPTKLVEEIVSETEWPSLQEALTAKMRDWNLRS